MSQPDPSDAASRSDPASAAAVLPPTLELGTVHLTVSDLARAVSFYERCIGLRTHRRAGGAAFMGVGQVDLVVLVEDGEARRARRKAGLTHYALLSPTRKEFARAVLRAAVTRTLVEASTDDGFSETIFITDPDGIGLALYIDHPQDTWPSRAPDGSHDTPITQLDLPALMRFVDDRGLRRQAEPGLVVGHVQLSIGDIEQALAFYRDVLGFEVVGASDSAAYLAVGGYHLHLALDTTRGAGVAAQPPGVIGLRQWTIALEDEQQVEAVRARVVAAGIEPEERGGGLFVRDPWSLGVVIKARPPRVLQTHAG